MAIFKNQNLIKTVSSTTSNVLVLAVFAVLSISCYVAFYVNGTPIFLILGIILTGICFLMFSANQEVHGRTRLEMWVSQAKHLAYKKFNIPLESVDFTNQTLKIGEVRFMGLNQVDRHLIGYDVEQVDVKSTNTTAELEDTMTQEDYANNFKSFCSKLKEKTSYTVIMDKEKAQTPVDQFAKLNISYSKYNELNEFKYKVAIDFKDEKNTQSLNQGIQESTLTASKISNHDLLNYLSQN